MFYENSTDVQCHNNMKNELRAAYGTLQIVFANCLRRL